MPTLLNICFVLILLMSLVISSNDIRYRRIKNSHIVLLAVCCMAFQVINGIHLISFITAILALGLGFIVFQLGFIGAGDVKLYSVYLMAISPTYSLLSIYAILAVGALESCGYLVIGALTNRVSYIRARGVPYGVAISLVSVCCIWLSYN